MMARLQALLARFDALTQRERALVATAIVGGVLLVGNSIFIDLPLARAKSLSRQLISDRNELQTLEAQLTVLQREMRDPDDERRAHLADMKKQLQDLRGALTQHEQLLVPPQEINRLLEQLLARHASLRLVSLQTLPTVPADAPEAVPDKAGAPAEAAGANNDKANATRVRPDLEVWRHGVEIRVQGSYSELAAYMAELEGLPQRLVFGEVRLKADYPKSELHLKLYTYSLDPAWLRL